MRHSCCHFPLGLSLPFPLALHMERTLNRPGRAGPSQVYPRDTDNARYQIYPMPAPFAAPSHLVGPFVAVAQRRLRMRPSFQPVFPSPHLSIFSFAQPSVSVSQAMRMAMEMGMGMAIVWALNPLDGATGTHLECAPLIRSIISMDL